MTNEELALKKLSELEKTYRNAPSTSMFSEFMRIYITVDDLAEAVKSLEKQIPKHPNLEGDGYDGKGNMIYDTWICPCCEKSYEVDYDKYEYCPCCGQHIDRSYEE